VLDLAKHLDLSVVAEGVETEEQLNYVKSRGCDYVQGYLTGKPMPAHVAIAALKENLYTELLPNDLRASQT
jgi:EAL domain-containing protein (putative c-di-GMP-specific phosphodiesterase class I)